MFYRVRAYFCSGLKFCCEMKRMFVSMIVLIVFQVVAPGQDERMRAIAEVTGADVEEVGEEEFERLSDLLNRPLQINVARQKELSSSGILTRYQIASLMDYIQRNGPLMSYSELSAVDGFGTDLVGRLRPFISLDLVPVSKERRPDSEVALRCSMRASDGLERWGYSLRYRIEAGEKVAASAAATRSLGPSLSFPDTFCGSVKWCLERAPLTIVAGDFNARFGQGLAMWSGMHISSLTSPSSFMRRPSGISASSSFTGTGTYTGVGTEASFGRVTLSLILAATGLRTIRTSPEKLCLVPACNITYGGRHTQFGLTHNMGFSGLDRFSAPGIPSMKTSADFSACFSGVDVFAEICHDWVTSAQSCLAGTVFPIYEVADMAAMLRLSKEEYAASFSCGLKTGRWMKMNAEPMSRRRIDGSLSADAALYMVPETDTQDRSLQVKLQSQWHFALSESFLLTLRVAERIRSWGVRFRTDVRSDLAWSSGRFGSTIRLNLLRGKKTALLGYLEGAYKGGILALHLRQGVFCVDEWDDRIYVYERDVPGCFNVPAFYGRGVWTSLLVSCRASRWCRICLRLAGTAYPMMKEKKPGKAELRLQSVFDF